MYVDQSVPRRSRRPWRVEEYQPYRVEPPQPPAAVVGMVAGLRLLERVAGLSYSFYTPYVQCPYIMWARLRSRSPWFGAEVDGVVFFGCLVHRSGSAVLDSWPHNPTHACSDLDKHVVVIATFATQPPACSVDVVVRFGGTSVSFEIHLAVESS